MKQYTKRMLALVLATALLITCGISGLVLPAAAEKGDVLLSEDFEGAEYNATIKKWWQNGTVVEDPLNAGNKVLKLTTKLNATYSSKKFGLKVNSTYMFTFKSYGGYKVYAGFNKSKGIWNEGVNKYVDGRNGSWIEHAYIVKTTDRYNNFNDDNYTISVTAPVGTYLDDFKLVEIENASQEELIIGGDFEYPTAVYEHGPWYYIHNKLGEIVEDPDDPTNRVLHLKAKGNGIDNGYRGRIGLLPNSTYVLKMRAKGKNLNFYLSSGKGIATQAGWHTVLDDTGVDTWTDYSLTFTTKSSVTEDSYLLIIGDDGKQVKGMPDAYIDDFSITQAPATAITMPQDELYQAQGTTELMDLTVEPIGGKLDSIVWTSSDETIATVDANGNVTTATDKTGVVTITATAMVNGQPLVASRVITVVGNADTFAFKDEAFHLIPGTKKTAVVVASPKGAKVGNLAFVSSNEEVATVDANGVVTAVAAGTATITVKNADNAIFAEDVADTLTVTVDEFGERVVGGDFETADSAVVMNGVGTVVKDTADRENNVLQLGKDTSFALAGVTLNPNKSYTVTFNARGTDVTTTITGSVAGAKDSKKTTLKADAWTKVSYTFTTGTEAAGIALKSSAAVELDNISVVELPELTAIATVPGGTVLVLPESSASISVAAKPDGAFTGDVTYASSNEEVLKVDASGKITVLATESGEATITATTKNEKGDILTATTTYKVDEYANMLSNGDFEQGVTNWKGNTSGFVVADQIVDGAGRDGGKGVVLSNDLGKKIEIFYKPAIPLKPGTTYEVSFDYKTTKASIVRLWTGTLGFGQVYTGNSNGEWKTASKVFTTSSSMKLNPSWDFAIVIEEGGNAEMAVDNMCLKLYNSGVAAESIEMTRKEIRLVPGRSTGLGVQATPSNGDVNMLKWTSSNENVATVEYGVVTAVGKGKATITATTRNGKKATATVIVSGSEVMIGNGTFDVKNDNSWKVEGSAIIADGVGVNKTAGGKIEKAEAGAEAGKLSQIVKNLKPETNYTLTLRLAGKGDAGIKLTNGTTALVSATESAETAYVTKSYKFTTGATLEAETLFELTLAAGDGPITFDYVLLSEDATLIDMVVNDIYWYAKEPLEQDHQVKTGTELKFVVTVLNQGEDPIKAGMTFDVDVKIDAKTVETITFTAPENVEPGGLAIVEGVKSWKAVAGDHTVSAGANTTLSILELDDSNNDNFQKSLRVADELFEVPELAELAGFDELIFNDEFDSLHTIDTMGAGEAGYKWYITRPFSNYKQTPDDYSIKDGILTMKNANSQYNYGMATIDDTTERGFTFNKGYLEFRLRIPDYDASKSGGPAIWSFPPDKITETAAKGYAVQWVEMDWMEYWGITKERPGGHWTISMHETIRAEKENGTGDTQNVLAQHSAPGRHKEGLGDAQWHTISFLWLDDMIVAYLDGEQCFKFSYGEGIIPGTVINAATEDGTGAFAYMNEQQLALILGGSIDNQMEVDYIRVWSGVGSGYVPPAKDEEEKEEGQGTIDMDAGVFYNSFCLDDWGEPIMIETMDEFSAEYILMGEEYWVQLSDARKQEINGALAVNGQPTFEELLAAAKALLSGESPDTGETATLPLVCAVSMIVCAAALVLTRKRRVHN